VKIGDWPFCQARPRGDLTVHCDAPEGSGHRKRPQRHQALKAYDRRGADRRARFLPSRQNMRQAQNLDRLVVPGAQAIPRLPEIILARSQSLTAITFAPLPPLSPHEPEDYNKAAGHKACRSIVTGTAVDMISSKTRVRPPASNRSSVPIKSANGPDRMRTDCPLASPTSRRSNA
jgi:hypothetical protein